MKRKRQVYEILIPKGYEYEDMLDTDDSGYDFEDAVLHEEVMLVHEQEN